MTNEGVRAPSNRPPLRRTKVAGVYQRPGGSYTVRTRVRGRQVTRAARTLAEARNILADLRSDPRLAAVDPRLTVQSYGQEWLKTYQGRRGGRIRTETLESYRRSLERHVFPWIGPIRLGELSPRDVKALAHRLLPSLRPASVRRTLAPLKAMLADAAEEGLIRASPAANVRIPLPAEQVADRVKALTELELAQLIEGAGTGRDQLMLRLQVAAGLRTGELLGLRWTDVRPRHVEVRRSVSRRGQIGPPKSKAGTRTVPIPATLSRDLARFQRTSRSQADDFVFSSTAGTPMDPKNYDHRVFAPAARRAEVPWASPHWLRHTFVTRMIAAGANVKQVQVAAGHSSVQVTLDVYGHLFPDDLPSAIPEVATVRHQAGSFLDPAPETPRARHRGVEAAAGEEALARPRGSSAR